MSPKPVKPSAPKTIPVERKKKQDIDDDNFEEFINEELDLHDYTTETQPSDQHLSRLKNGIFRRKS